MRTRSLAPRTWAEDLVPATVMVAIAAMEPVTNSRLVNLLMDWILRVGEKRLFHLFIPRRPTGCNEKIQACAGSTWMAYSAGGPLRRMGSKDGTASLSGVRFMAKPQRT